MTAFSKLLAAANDFYAASIVPSSEEPLPKHRKSDIGCSSSDSSNGSSPHSNLTTEIEKEIKAHRAEEPIDKDSDPLEWWCLNNHHFITLSRLAQRLLSESIDMNGFLFALYYIMLKKVIDVVL